MRKANSTRRGVSVTLMLSHFMTSICSVYIGYFLGMTKECQPCQSLPSETSPLQNRRQELQRQHKQRIDVSNSYPLLPPGMRQLFVGMGRLKRDDFARVYDSGVPMNPSVRGNEEVLILYGGTSLPPGDAVSSSDVIPLFESPEDATRNCISLNMVLMRANENGQCLAVVGQWPSPNVHKWMRFSEVPGEGVSLQQPMKLVSRSHSAITGSFIDVPKRHYVQHAFKKLTEYLNGFDETVRKLRPVARAVVKGHKDNTIIIMICNHGQSELFINFVCSARSRNLDTSRILLFATDIETKELAESLGIATFYDEKNFGDVPKGAAQIYGDLVFSNVMLAKVYCVHLTNLLGYNVLFQDVDLIWYKHPLDFFLAPDAGDWDMYFQDDGSRTTRYEPWSPNTGFYFVRHNKRTRYFLSFLIRMGDVIFDTGSHQQALNNLLNEHTSLYNLKVKVLNREDNDFPGGYHFHRRFDYMKDLIQGNVEPYIFHMSWTENKGNKRLYLEQIGGFWVSDQCVGKTAADILEGRSEDLAASCCLAEPLVKCHYRDKPSKIPCRDSPPIDKGKPSFW